MRFKGIELKENTEAELLIAIEIVGIEDSDELEEYGEELEETLEDILDYDNCNPYVDFVDDNLLNVRCDDITFDKNGVEVLTEIYNDIVSSNIQNVNIMIDVHVDEWFKGREDGTEYNEDSVTLEEFLNNLEY